MMTKTQLQKNMENNKTSTNVIKMTEDEKVNEIARIIGGVKITDNTLMSAKEMLNQSSDYKNGELL